ncbi:MAG: hypothetical protein QOI10_833 [Solirubrobacterales bacterium]|jgi:WD40 repeat protein|nr:hypothetical protein [Solirubrobacterales bacterium]
MSDLFLSYSRRDDAFARHLHEALGAADQDVWADWEDIAPTADWMATIYEAIEDADAFVYVISPDSVGSEICGRELAHAAGLNKRIIPLLRTAVDPKLVPEPAARHQWIGFSSDEGFDAAVTELMAALATDLEWAASHTHWLQRARDWDDGGREKSKLLRGTDLRAAEGWLSEQRPDRTPQPTALQSEYVGVSRRAAARRQRVGMIGVVAALVIAIALAAVALVQRNEANNQKRLAQEQTREAQSQALAASAGSLGHSDTALSVRLAAAAVRTSSTAHTQATLRRSLAGVGDALLLSGGDGVVWSVAYSPDATQLATAGDDGSVRIWDAETGQQLQELRTGSTVLDVAFSTDGRQVATASEDGSIRVFGAASGERLKRLDANGAAVAVAFSPNGQGLASANTRGVVRVFNLASGNFARRKFGDVAYDLAFSPSGGRLAVATAEGLRVFDTNRNGRELQRPRTDEAIFGVAFSPDGRQIAVTPDAGGAEILQAATGRLVRALPGELGSLSVAFSPDGDAIAIMTRAPGTVQVRAVATGELLATLRGHTAAITGLQFSPDGARLATASRDGTARVWDRPREPGRTPAGQGGGVDDVAYSPDGTLLAIGGDRSAQIFDANDVRVQEMRDDVGVSAVAFSPDGARLVTASRGRTASVWEIGTGDRLGVLRGHDRRVRDAAFSPDGAKIVTASADRTARIWSADSGERFLTVHPGGGVDAVAYSPDGDLIATGSRYGPVQLWDSTTGARIRSVDNTGSSPTFGLAFSPDGKRLAIGSEDGTAQVSDAATGKRIATMRGHSRSIDGVAFSPDGTLVGTTSDDGTARLWDSATGEQVGIVENGDKSVYSIAFSPDGNRVATADGKARIFPCGFACASVDELLAAADARAGVLTADERAQYLGG